MWPLGGRCTPIKWCMYVWACVLWGCFLYHFVTLWKFTNCFTHSHYCLTILLVSVVFSKCALRQNYIFLYKWDFICVWMSKYSYIYVLVLLFSAYVCVLFAWQHPSALITSAQTLTFCSREERREDLKSHLSLPFNVCESVCSETCMNTCVQAMGVPTWWRFLCEA